jgi:small conductance mechanosensitive channel
MDKKILISNVSLDNFLIFIFVFIITLVIGNLLHVLFRKLFDEKLSPRYSKVGARTIEYSVFAAGLYYGINQVLHFDLPAFMASLGVLSIAIAFSSQQIIQNVFAGILISIRQPIRFDDWVEIAGSGVSRVKDIALTQTVLRTVTGKLIYIPNAALLSSNIINYTKSGFIEVTIPLSVPYTTEYKKIEQIVAAVALHNQQILPNLAHSKEWLPTKLRDFPVLKTFLHNDYNSHTFDPHVYIVDLLEKKMTLHIRLWIRDIEKKEAIVTEFIDHLLPELQKGKIELI